MRLGRDGIAGLIGLAISLLLLPQAFGLPRLPIVPIGPGFYPALVLVFMAATSALLVIQDLVAQRATSPVPAEPAPAAPKRNYRLVLAAFVAVGVYIGLLPLLGFRIATALFVAGFQMVLERPTTLRQWGIQLAIAVGTAAITGCIGLAVIKGYNMGLDPAYRRMQSPPIFSSAVRTDEEVLPRTVELVAKWDALGDTRREFRLPAQKTLTFRLARRFTFDEALILWERTASRPPTTRGLFQLGQAYRRVARAGDRAAAKRAIEFFERYFVSGEPLEHADEARRAITELGKVQP